MSRIATSRHAISGVRRHLKLGSSLAVLSLAVGLSPLSAGAAPFDTMVGLSSGHYVLPNGQAAQWTGAQAPVIGTTADGRPLMSIEQTQQKALLDWEDFRLKTGEVLEFKQQTADWIAVNRVHGAQAARVDGELRALGKVYIFNDNGVLVGEGAQINTRALITGAGFSDVLVDGSTTTLVQSKQKGVLDWHSVSAGTNVWNNLSVQTGEVLKFQQQAADWYAVNRVALRKNAETGAILDGNAQASVINGEIAAQGDVYIFNDAGVNFNVTLRSDRPDLGDNHYDSLVSSVTVRTQDGRVQLRETGAKVSARTLVTGTGFSDVLREGATTTLVQSQEKARLDWSNLDLAAGQTLKFQQADKNWIALNRDYSGSVVRLDGNIKADGNLYLIGNAGLSVDGAIEAQQVVLSSLHMRNDQFENGGNGGLVSYARDYNDRTDPTFSNSWAYHRGSNSGVAAEDITITREWVEYGWMPGGYWSETVTYTYPSDVVDASSYYRLSGTGPEISDPNDPLKYNVTIGKTGSVSTGAFGKVILAGPNVTNKGTISVQDEGQVLLAAGENVYFRKEGVLNETVRSGMLTAYVGAWNPMAFMRSNIPYRRPPQTASTQEWADFYSELLGRDVALGETLPYDEFNRLTANATVNGVYTPGGLIGKYLNDMQAERARTNGFTARNEGLISAKRGGNVDFRGHTLEQFGIVDMTSTASFRGQITFRTLVSDYFEYVNGDAGYGPLVPGYGDVIFGEGSLTQITPDLEATDTIPVTEGAQSVGELRINANSVHMRENSLIHMPSGKIVVALDAAGHVHNNNIGEGANQGNEDGTRFLMEKGATIDLSGWDVTLEMGYHQVKGKLFAAQLADSPLQKDGPLYRKEIAVDRRYGTNVANWNSLDNLSQGTLGQFLTNGGTFDLYVGDDFIMKPGSVIDVSGGVTTYKEGYVYTTLLRRLDGSVIDIREADPDELYMGLANEWVVYDTKWQQSTTYYIPLLSSAKGVWEESYQHGGEAGWIKILAPDAVLHGTVRGETVSGKYQRNNPLPGGLFSLNAHAGNNENEYVSNNLLITAQENALDASFGFRDRLSDVYGDLFGDEFDPATDPVSSDGQHRGNTTLASQGFFNRSSMGSYELEQRGRVTSDFNFPPEDGIAVIVEEGVNLDLQNGASFSIVAGQRMEFLGSIRTVGGDVSLSAMSLKFADDSKIDTSGLWYSDYEVVGSALDIQTPRIHGGNISLSVASDFDLQRPPVGDIEFTLPETMQLDASGGAWVSRGGTVTNGKGGNLSLGITLNPTDSLDLSALPHARAYGLGGNGTFSLAFGDDIVIGHELPEAEPGYEGRPPMLFTPDFFENSGFSAISLSGRNVLVREGTEVRASSASLVLRPNLLEGKDRPAIWYETGSSIYDVANIVALPPEGRPASLRKGMDITLSGTLSYGEIQGRNVTLEEGALLATEVGGHISLSGDYLQIDGTIFAPAGAITLNAGMATNPYDRSTVSLSETARLLAPGAALLTRRGLDSQGREVREGELHDGGDITLTGSTVDLAAGSVLDVSGTQATFDVLEVGQAGGVVRNPVTLHSNGGSLSITGEKLSINDATYRAHAGGENASGGRLSIDWQGRLSEGGGGSTSTPEQVVDQIEMYASWGYLVDESWNLISDTPYGFDLSLVAWTAMWGVDPGFAPGTVINSREELLAVVSGFNAAASAHPPVFVIGDPMTNIPVAPPPPEVSGAMIWLLQNFGGYTVPEIPTGGTTIVNLTTQKIGEGGFSDLNLSSSIGFLFNGAVNLGGKKADGGYVFDTITLAAPTLAGLEGAKVTLEAGVVNLNTALGGSGGYTQLLENFGYQAENPGTVIDVRGGTLLQVESASFYGFEDTRLTSGGDIRLKGFALGSSWERPSGTLHSTAKLTLKADQVYAGTGRIFTISSDKAIEILAQDDGGPVNGSPYEAVAQLTLKAPSITQGGTLRSPLGTLTLEADSLIFRPGSVTSVSAEGKVIPYGYLSNGDAWLDPFTGIELTTLPSKTLNLIADTVDLQAGATLDVSGGGDLYAREFVPGMNGTQDWLSGYFDFQPENAHLAQEDKWVEAAAHIYAIVPGFEGNIAPLGFGASQIGVGDKVYLSGGSGLAAGYYTLLPAEYALLPGAYRVTAEHRYQGMNGQPVGSNLYLHDGSSIQTGYGIDGASGGRTQRTVAYHVMSDQTLRTRSQYKETTANTFFVSEDFLKKALRDNRPVGDIPRIPLDGGSVVFRVTERLDLNGTLKSGAGEGGRGGFADIASEKVLVAGADTDLDAYEGYLVLRSDQLSEFRAESLLLGGVRTQGESSLELEVVSTDVVVDNAGSVLYGPELLFASKGDIEVRAGAKLETRGRISGSSGDIRIVASIPAFTDDMGTPGYPNDDVVVHAVLDQGAVLRVSSDNQVDILRNTQAVTEANRLRNDPAALAAINAQREAKGLAPLSLDGGVLSIADGASIIASGSAAFDATWDTRLAQGVALQTPQLSAAASRISVGETVPAGTEGLIFAAAALGTLGNAAELTLKSYSSIDLYGGTTLSSSGALRLDTAEIRVVDANGQPTTLRAKTLTLTNVDAATASAVTGNAVLKLEADNVYFAGADKWLSGINRLDINARERVIGSGDSTVFIPGAVSITAGGLTSESGARLFLDATGAIDVVSNGNAALPVFQSFGGTLGLTGTAISYQGQTRMTGGNLILQARNGNVVLGEGSVLDVTSNVAQFFDKTVGVGAGSVSLIADSGNIDLRAGSLIDVSGSAAGGDAGTLTIRAGLGQASLGGTVKGTAAQGSRSGSFSLLTATLADFSGFNAVLDAGGFAQGRRFEINSGNVTLDGTVNVNDFALIVNDGAALVTGTVRTSGADGGRIQISAAEAVSLAGSARLLAAAGAADGSGGTVILETTGRNGGVISMATGSLIDVTGTGEGGRLVRLRAPQTGTDVAIGQLAGTITGARAVLAEGFRVYEGIETIDQGVIDLVSSDATAFMSANGAAIRNRLGTGVTLVAGIELRSDADMELTQDWDLSGLRFDGAAGVLSLRARGDLLINANLSDGFTADNALLGGESWAFNLTAGANTQSPDTLAVLAGALLAEGKGHVIVGGTPDTIEYYYDPAYGNEHRLYVLGEDGKFVYGSDAGFTELARDPDTGKYIDPLTGSLIEKDPVTGDYADTLRYARRPLPWIPYEEANGGSFKADGSAGYIQYNGIGEPYDGFDPRLYSQWNNATGYHVRTGTGTINVAAARDLVLEERPSVIYTAGIAAPALDGFYIPASAYASALKPAQAQYGIAGGDITVRVTGSIVASSDTPQLPNGYMRVRGSFDQVTGLYATVADRLRNQTTWWVDHANFQGGIGALGGGNIRIDAEGDIVNLGVAIPNSFRAAGHEDMPDGTRSPLVGNYSGGGNLSLNAGGNLYGGAFYVADGTGDMTVGGSVQAGSTVRTLPASFCSGYSMSCYIHTDFFTQATQYSLYTLLFTSSGQFNLKSAGDLNIDAVIDPMMIPQSRIAGMPVLSYSETASVNLFSAGGDITMWSNGLNISIAQDSSGYTNLNPNADPLHFYSNTSRHYGRGHDYIAWDLRPANMSLVAANGDVRMIGGVIMAPAAKGNLEILAGGGVQIGSETQARDPYAYDPDAWRIATQKRSGTGYEGILMSQSLLSLFHTPTSIRTNGSSNSRIYFVNAGPGTVYPGYSPFTQDLVPDLHKGDTEPARIYAAGGDVVISSGGTTYGGTAASAEVRIPKQLWVQAEGNVYFPSFTIQHNNANDFSIVRAGKGIYFNTPSAYQADQGTLSTQHGRIYVSGPGRLEVEAGTDLWLPATVADYQNNISGGILSQRVTVLEKIPGNGESVASMELNPDEKAADIAISVGYNQQPDYAGFENVYLNPDNAGLKDYLIDGETGKSLYLFDREYARAEGATGEFAVPEPREGLVNYVRRLQGLQPLRTKAEQVAYLDQAWAYWQGLATDYKTPYYRSVLFLELRTTGREANDADNARYNTTFRGYDAIATLFPGAQKSPDEALAEGESRWEGDFETYASRVMSFGGGKVEFVIPGGAMTLANVAARPGETGQPDESNARGNAFRAGIVTADGGEVNILTNGSVTVNESRILTSKGGNVLIWSSWGDIAAGKGAKTSLSPQFYDYQLDNWGRMSREPAGLPTGAGIGTLATQDGTPPADVDLIAPAGVVDAGDAGIRVSGNFNVFAVEVLGTDNIEVAGITTGLPVPPALPPTALDIDVSSRNDLVEKVLADTLAQVQKDRAVVSPSLIEVRVSDEEELEEADGCTAVDPAERPEDCAPVETVPGEPLAAAPQAVQTPLRVSVSLPEPKIDFALAAQPVNESVRQVAETSGFNILYDADLLIRRDAPALKGKMTTAEALERLLQDQGVSVVRVGPRTIMLKKTHS